LTDSTDENLKVIADPDMINLVIRNLVSNSIKFCETGGKIEISSTYHKNQLCLMVKDNGVGIESGRLLKLFGNENSSTRGTHSETGTGLGLILCKDFIEKNDGRIWAESAPQQGSSFYFTLRMSA
jgi:signal transduction histidine kinase